jgi:LacI family transcriptional regulator
MPVVWNLKKWLAVEHDIYRPSELQALLKEKAGVQLSLQAISALFNGRPTALRLQTMQALCNALGCKLSDFCDVLPDRAGVTAEGRGKEIPRRLYGARVAEPSIPLEYIGPGSGGERSVTSSSVDPATREIILRILEEQGLVLRENSLVSRPRTLRQRLIGMLIPSWIWPLITDLMRGIVETITSTSYDLVLYSIKEEELEREDNEVIGRLLTTQQTAGLLAVFPGRASRYLGKMYEQGFPVVTIDDQEAQTTPCIGVDNVNGAYMAVRHLIRLGHRRIAHIKGPARYLVSQDRYQGYCQALQEAGIMLDSDLVLEGDFMPPSGRACAHQLFALPPDKRPTAIFAAADQMAYGVLAAAEECGVAIPQDLALVGFDDDAPSVHIHPALTTVRQPYFEMGQRAIELLLSMLDSLSREKQVLNSSARPVRLLLPTSLIVRESCGMSRRSSVPAPSDGDVL